MFICLGAAPPPALDPALHAPPDTLALIEGTWLELERVGTRAGLPTSPRPALELRRARQLRPGHAGRSRPGRIELRPATELALWTATLRHELAHQWLFVACPAAAGDRLFHEAFALAVSGEAAQWSDGQYLSISQARAELARARDLDSKEARRAVLRFLADAPATPEGLPLLLFERLASCASGARWTSLTLGAGTAVTGAEDALVVLSLATGEQLLAEGASELAMPFGSTLKPFLVAGSTGAPGLAPDPARADWSCGQDLPARLEAPAALARSCNGYFLDWIARDPAVAGLGSFAPALLALGLPRAPEDGSEAIGLRPTLALSPWALAQAYRLLAVSRPEVLAALRETPRSGTLAGLEPAPPGWAFKTGTVRDEHSRPSLGWIVAVSAERVAVMARRGRAPRSFFAELLRRLPPAPEQQPVEVQVFGLLSPGAVEVQCAGHGFVAAPRPLSFGSGFLPLLPLARQGPVLCLGRPFLARYPGLEQPREYAGSFRHDPAPPYRPAAGAPPAHSGAERARRGSDLTFRTGWLRYTAGVLAAEDAAIRGGARAALVRVVGHNVRAGGRHGPRPLCDTTHCQTFLGTRRPLPEDAAALLAEEPALPAGWLSFSQGGSEPWEEGRAAGEVEGLLGPGVTLLSFGSGKVRVLAPLGPGEGEEPQEVPCERLRGPLRLPSCPASFRREAGRYHFSGVGRGHGEGLELERAKQSGQSARALLEEAYGLTATSRR